MLYEHFWQVSVYKGHDRAIVEFRAGDSTVNSRPKEEDEIANYLEARYVSASEACHRLFSFELHANLSHEISSSSGG